MRQLQNESDDTPMPGATVVPFTDIRYGTTNPMGVYLPVWTFLRKMDLAKIIDKQVTELRGNAKRLSHGTTVEILILYLFSGNHAIYRCEEWVQQTGYLRLLYPKLKPEYLSEDRIGDTFDALFNAKIGNIIFQQCCDVVRIWDIDLARINIDLSNVTVYGEYEVKKGSQQQKQLKSIKVEYGGHAKSGRNDLKQFGLELAVAEDKVPIYFGTVSGSTSDTTRYTPIFHDILGMKEHIENMVVVGDSKLCTRPNLSDIADHKGYYVGPEYMHSDKKLNGYLKQGTLKFICEVENRKIPDGGKTVYSGFELDSSHSFKKKKYLQRTLIIKSSTKEFEDKRTLDYKIDVVCKLLQQLVDKGKGAGINNSKQKAYSSDNAAKNAVSKLKYYQSVKDIVEVITEKRSGVQKKKVGPGRPNDHSVYVSEEVIWYVVASYSINAEKLELKKKLCGISVLLTNLPVDRASMEVVINYHRTEYEVERNFSRLKTSLGLSPVYLHLPSRIEILMYLFMTGVQIMSLMDRTARIFLSNSGSKLSLNPGKPGCSHPSAEFMLKAVENLSILFQNADGVLRAKFSKSQPIVSEVYSALGVKTTHFDASGLYEMVRVAMATNRESFEKYLEDYVYC